MVSMPGWKKAAVLATVVLTGCQTGQGPRSLARTQGAAAAIPQVPSASASTTTTEPPESTEKNVGTPDFLDANEGFAPVGVVCESPPCRIDVEATTDGGLTWHRQNRETLAIENSSLLSEPQPILHFATPTVGWLYAVPKPPDTHGGQLWRTTNGGQTWATT